MDPLNSISNIANKTDVKRASFSGDGSISSVSFLDSMSELKKAQNMVVTKNAEENSLGFNLNKEKSVFEFGRTEEDEIEDKVKQFMGKIKKILNENKK